MFENFNFAKLLDLKRIFETTPGTFFKFYKEFAVFFGLLFVLGVSIRVYLIFKKNKVWKKLLNRIKTLVFTVSILGFLYLFFRSENIFLFSSRFILVTILLTFLVWAAVLAIVVYLKLPQELKNYQKQLLIKKYLPRKKK